MGMHIPILNLDHSLQASSGELLTLRQRASETEYQLQMAEGGRTQLGERVRQLEGFLQDARRYGLLYLVCTAVPCVKALQLGGWVHQFEGSVQDA